MNIELEPQLSLLWCSRGNLAVWGSSPPMAPSLLEDSGPWLTLTWGLGVSCSWCWWDPWNGGRQGSGWDHHCYVGMLRFQLGNAVYSCCLMEMMRKGSTGSSFTAHWAEGIIIMLSFLAMILRLMEGMWGSRGRFLRWIQSSSKFWDSDDFDAPLPSLVLSVHLQCDLMWLTEGVWVLWGMQ